MSHVLSCRWCFYVCWSAVRPVQGLLGGVGFCSSLLGVSENRLRFTGHMAIHQKMMRQWWETRPLENRWVGLFSDKPILGLVALEHFTSRCWMSLGNKASSGASHPLIWSMEAIGKTYGTCMEMSGMSKKNGHTNHKMLQAHWFSIKYNYQGMMITTITGPVVNPATRPGPRSNIEKGSSPNWWSLELRLLLPIPRTDFADKMFD